MVTHDLLISEFRAFKLDNSVIAWIAEYLRARHQSVVLNGFSSVHMYR